MIDLSAFFHAAPRDGGYIDNRRDLLVNGCGYRKCLTRNLTVTKKSGRLDYQIFFVAEGRGLFKLDGRVEEIGRGNLLICLPRIGFNYSLRAEDAPELYWLCFTGGKAKSVLERCLLHKNAPRYVGFSGEAVNLFRRILVELQLKRPYFEEHCEAYLAELLTHFARRLAEGPEARLRPEAIRRTAEQLQLNYRKEVTVDELARSAGLSRHRFLHLFKEVMDCPPIEYLLRIRIEKAKELLVDSGMNVSETAEVVGYDNALYFSRLFKKKTGFSPLEWRRNNRF